MSKEVNYDYWLVIWTRFKSGDQEAFAILYNHYINTLYSYGLKLCKDKEVVKDALQDLFLELFLNRDKIRVSPEHLKFYLLLALKRNLIKKLKAGRKVSHELNETLDFEPQYSIEFQIMEQEKDEEINRKVLYAIKQLPAKQKEAIYLRFNESLEYEDISAIMEITVESVRKQVHRGLKTVREIVGSELVTVLFALLLKKS